MRFPPKAVGALVTQAREGKHTIERLPFVKASFDDGSPPVWGINDIFIGRKDHVSARYKISFGSQTEHQSSSGIIVSTGVGSTGWLCSIVAMVEGLTHERTTHKLSSLPDTTSNELIFVVREPFPSPNTGTTIVSGHINLRKSLVISSEMPDGGFIFSDGITEKAVEWNAGSKVVISVGDRYLQRIVR